MKYILLFACFSSVSVFGQFSTSILDFNNVSAYVTDGGVLFSNTVSSNPGYEIPKGSGNHAIYSSAFWFGGTDVNGQIHLSGTRFNGGEEIFPGPIADPAMYSSADYTNQYLNSVWTVLRSDIDDHILNWNQSGYTAPASIANWPGNGDTSLGVADQLAPYVDLNNNAIYEPALGEYPEIRGDQATYIIMNDARQIHTGSGGDVLGIEVHQMIYQYATTDFRDNTTFINTRVFNRGTITYLDFRSSFYVDGDLGDPTDDYMGSDSLRKMIFTYNGSLVDSEYGANPPAIGITSLSTPMSGAGYYSNGASGTQTDPSTAAQYWNYMNNKWRFGDDWVYGGTGFPGSSGSTSALTSYMFGGDPSDSTQWSESGMNNPIGDRRMFMNLESTSFGPGEMICYDLAVVYGQGMAPFGSVTDLKVNAELAQAFFDAQNFSCDVVTVGTDELSLLETSIYPNPSSGLVNILIQQPVDYLTVKVFDIAGRIVYSEALQNQQEIKLDLNGHKGVYIVQVESEEGSAIERILIE